MVAVEVISTVDEGSLGEHLHAALSVCRESQLALCIVGWLATRESVVLVPDPIVFAQSSVLLDRGEPCDSQDTPDDAALLRIGKSDVYQQQMASCKSLAVCCPLVQWTPSFVVVLCSLFLSHAQSPVHRQGDLGDEVDGLNGDTIKLLSDDRPKRGALWNSRKTRVAQGCVLLTRPLRTGNFIAVAGRKRRRRLQ